MAPTQKEEFKGDKGLASPQTRNSGFVERLEIAEPRAVIQHQDGHDLAVDQPWLRPALLGRLGLFAQQPSLPMRAKRLTKIIEWAEILHEPVEHRRLPTSDGADSKRGIQRRQGFSLTSNP